MGEATNEQILIGTISALLCLFAFTQTAWLLENTRKGQRLVRWAGPRRAVWIVKLLCLAGMLFGTLLALNIIRPVDWNS